MARACLRRAPLAHRDDIYHDRQRHHNQEAQVRQVLRAMPPRWVTRRTRPVPLGGH
jgi:hypothetical protein